MADFEAVIMDIGVAVEAPDSTGASPLWLTSLNPEEAYSANFANKVWDTAHGGWYYWYTALPDPNGDEYNGPGTWGVQTSNYRVEAIRYTRG